MNALKRTRTASGTVIYTESAPTHRIAKAIIFGCTAGGTLYLVGFFLTVGDILQNILG